MIAEPPDYGGRIEVDSPNKWNSYFQINKKGRLAASMSSAIACACDEMKIDSNAFLMVHNPWTYTVGDAKRHLAARGIPVRM